MFRSSLSLLFILSVFFGLNGCSGSGSPGFDEAQWRSELSEWQNNRVPRLVGERGWATVTGLDWLKEGANTMGSASGKDIHFAEGSAAASVGTVTLHDGMVHFEADPAAEVYQDSTRVTAVTLYMDDTGTPTRLRTGSIQFQVIRRGTQLAVRTWDAQAESAKSLTVIPSFEADPSWVKEATFVRYSPTRTLELYTTVNIPDISPADGYLEFEHDGQTHRLDVIARPGDTELFVIFGDLTNRSETYGAGRYLYVDRPDTAASRSTVIADFNRSFNPPCAFTAYATCAYPPEQNKLGIRIEAGEKRVP